jgi:hypothetical protein
MLVLPDDEMDSLKGLPQAQFQARIKELLAKYPITID